mmetsp:Transcript_5819/g.8562  ORF Transcript_5819/g.8562 Transcript_5819/m.8562 type:complete len:288 (+) Transcript_5819:801-1664(+)
MIMHALSIAVLIVCVLTLIGSHIPRSSIFASSPVIPLIPQLHLFFTNESSLAAAAAACFARSCVTIRITETPQFCASVRGMTSMASPTAKKGPFCNPSVTLCPASLNPIATAISVAPPPGSSLGSYTTLRTTCIASNKLRSISLSTSLLPPRSITVHALGSSHFSKKSIIFFANLTHFKQPTFGPNIALLDFICPRDNCCTSCPAHAIIISFTQTTKCSNIRLGKEMLSQIRDPLLGNDNIWLEGNNFGTHVFYVFFLHPQNGVPIILVGNFHVGLCFSFFIFQRAV